MCLIVFAWRPGHALPLIVAANRDEFYARPT
ncbi:NRDE family protein, partial [Pseudomonas putida]